MRFHFIPYLIGRANAPQLPGPLCVSFMKPSQGIVPDSVKDDPRHGTLILLSTMPWLASDSVKASPGWERGLPSPLALTLARYLA